MMRRTTVLLISIACLLFSCTPKKQKIVFIETTDIHGAILPYDFKYQKPLKNSLSGIYSYVKDLRNNNEVILLDNGDILQGQPSIYYSNFMDTINMHICAQSMNFMKYDLASVGNHDIEAGPRVYNKLVKDFSFPWLSANIIRTETGKPYFIPYKVLNRAGLKIAVLGLTTPGIPQWLSPDTYEGMEFEDMVSSAKKWIPIIKKNEKPDVIVGLFHAGMSNQREYLNDSTSFESASYRVANEVQGFDLIFVGHDHKVWNEKITNKFGEEVRIVGAAGRGQYIGKVELAVEKDFFGNVKTKEFKTEVMATDTLRENKDFNAKFASFKNNVEDFTTTYVGKLAKDIFTGDALFGTSTYLNLLHDVQLDKTNADASISAPLSTNSTIKAGELKVLDLFKIYPYENSLLKIKLKGSELDRFLEYSYHNWVSSEDDGHVLAFQKDKHGNLIKGKYSPYRFKGLYFNFDAAGGIDYTVNIEREDFDKVEILKFQNGEKFHKDSTYTIAINSYRFSGGGGHMEYALEENFGKKEERIVSIYPRDLRFYIQEYIHDAEIYMPNAKVNWRFIPKKKAEKNINTDRALLFTK